MSVAEYTKKSITIPTELLASVDQVRKQRSLSAFISEALQRQVEREGLADLVRELDEVHGAMTDDEARHQAEALA
jgi:metal-responsive CopG/Arc/MetJ family transcriptional regulator